MKHTPLAQIHLAHGAKMVDFAGFYMPVSYKGIKEEHQTVRTGVGVFDVSHMGEFVVSGANALALVQQINSNDASKLRVGQAQYGCMPNLTGGIVDDLITYRTAEDAFLLVVNAANIQKDWDWLVLHNAQHGAILENRSEQTALLAVQGPLAASVLQPLTDVRLDAIRYYTFEMGTLAGIENVLISATGYTGSGGFELYLPAEQAVVAWQAIFQAGAAYGIQPIGLGARDTLRLEMGFALYGNDIDETTSPLEAGLGWVTKLEKGAFNGSEWLRAQKAQGTMRKLVGLEMTERGIPRQGYTIVDASGRAIGIVTSGSQSLTLQKSIGLGYVEKAFSVVGSAVFVVIRGKKIAAKIAKIPFYKPT